MNEPLTRSLQRTAGLRFSQFVAHWPAPAEFLRWADGRRRQEDTMRTRGEGFLGKMLGRGNGLRGSRDCLHLIGRSTLTCITLALVMSLPRWKSTRLNSSHLGIS